MANAIIFVAPISAFDQYLEEDPRINRIDDSLQLFTQICANSLLKKVHLVLFLSNCCLYRSGAYALTRVLPQIKQTSCGQSSLKDRKSTSSAYIHIPVSWIVHRRLFRSILSFGQRQNEYEVVVQYFRAHFLQVHRRNNENRRVLYTHLTSVVNTKTTQSIIANSRFSFRLI